MKICSQKQTIFQLERSDAQTVVKFLTPAGAIGKIMDPEFVQGIISRFFTTKVQAETIIQN
jgi:hypothetical protein